ncbi:maleylpyruvate isomerase family mycothiol-dependent enzyme [Nocardioides sp. B-3]|uniref:maleylpyruvate isomerase family mycothiol-dependent enzyme n=1 Tax=Nocardioides sp. B-3 TaxID=2895565 RepID=UPI002152BA32|nr:maleylpyruvate isomerase family mycothiol-dependent enzyme [Nocardioides sp. B-3]UUZ61333.1 maleylpyruvate isomerase family mycothiol-dependent enzyme [Nocardioides sp. B-3]
MRRTRGMMGQFTEQGVVARRDRTPDELINEIRACTTARHTQLLADPPTDPAAPAPGLFGAIGWNTRTLLKNRPLDLWMHEQDVRRALGMPGGLDSPAARHSADYLAESPGYVLAKKLKADPGTTVLLEVEGHAPVAATVTDEGRGRLLPEVPAEPTVALRTDRESFVVLAGGRRRPDAGRVQISGDEVPGQQLLDHPAVTP